MITLKVFMLSSGKITFFKGFTDFTFFGDFMTLGGIKRFPINKPKFVLQN